MLGLQGCKALTAAIVPLVVAASGGATFGYDGYDDDDDDDDDAGLLRWVDLSWVNAMDEECVMDMVTRSPRLAVNDYYGEPKKGAASHLFYKG